MLGRTDGRLGLGARAPIRLHSLRMRNKTLMYVVAGTHDAGGKMSANIHILQLHADTNAYHQTVINQAAQQTPYYLSTSAASAVNSTAATS